MPSAYGDKKKLTAAIHAHYLNVFGDRDARVQVLHALAKSLLGSRAHYQALLDRIDALRRVPVLIIWGMKDTAFQPYQLERWRSLLPNAVGRADCRRRALAARGRTGGGDRGDRAFPEIRLQRS